MCPRECGKSSLFTASERWMGITVDAATTLSAFVGTKRPSGSSGQVLPEVVR